MTDKAEHRVAMSDLVAERRSAGKPVWERTIHLGEKFYEAETWQERRDIFVDRVKGSSWYARQEEADLSELWQAIDEMTDAESQDHFEACLNGVYDEADYDRVWINR